jgi:hypothetical protein
MPSVEAPSPSASMDHFRTEVGHRAERLQRRDHRRAAGAAGAAALVVVLVASLLIVTPFGPRHTVASPLSRPAGPAKPPSGLLRPGPGTSGSAPAAPGDQAGSGGAYSGSGRPCRPHAVCIDAGALEPQGGLAATFRAQDNATAGISPVSVPTDGVLEFRLTSSTTTTWGRPTMTKGAALKRRPTTAGPGRTATTDFVPVVASGSAVVSVTCTGTGCAGPSYHVDVVVVAKAPSRASTTSTTR